MSFKCFVVLFSLSPECSGNINTKTQQEHMRKKNYRLIVLINIDGRVSQKMRSKIFEITCISRTSIFLGMQGWKYFLKKSGNIFHHIKSLNDKIILFQ